MVAPGVRSIAEAIPGPFRNAGSASARRARSVLPLHDGQLKHSPSTRRSAGRNAIPNHASTRTNRPSFRIENRRYLGNKAKLCGFIKGIVAKRCPGTRSVADLFAGTGVVGAAFNSPKIKIIANDLLQANHHCLKTFLRTTRQTSISRIQQRIDHLNSIRDTGHNYFSRHFGGKYFSKATAMRIGRVREEIERIADNEQERSVLLCSLIYAVDRIANTVGHYDAYRRTLDRSDKLILKIPEISREANAGNKIYCADANQLVRHIQCDVLYLDPPYNSRQYGDAYHLLENLVVWAQPAVRGKAGKMNTAALKSDYCTKKAESALEDLVKHAQCRHLLLSYNNTGNTKNSRSNARIDDATIMDILSSRGSVSVYHTGFGMFSAGKSTATGNVERVFHCAIR